MKGAFRNSAQEQVRIYTGLDGKSCLIESSDMGIFRQLFGFPLFPRGFFDNVERQIPRFVTVLLNCIGLFLPEYFQYFCTFCIYSIGSRSAQLWPAVASGIDFGHK